MNVGNFTQLKKHPIPRRSYPLGIRCFYLFLRFTSARNLLPGILPKPIFLLPLLCGDKIQNKKQPGDDNRNVRRIINRKNPEDGSEQ